VLPLIVQPSSARPVEPVRRDSSFAEKQEFYPALLLVVRCRRDAGRLAGFSHSRVSGAARRLVPGAVTERARARCGLGAFLRALDGDEQRAAARAGFDQRLIDPARGRRCAGPAFASIFGSGCQATVAVRPARRLRCRIVTAAASPSAITPSRLPAPMPASPQSMPSSARTGAGCGGLTTVAASRRAS
jgi:hypothetical protein